MTCTERARSPRVCDGAIVYEAKATMRRARQRAILEIIETGRVSSQSALVRALEKRGISPDASIADYLPSHWEVHADMRGISFTDLLAHKSVIRRFLDRGFDVYLVDWGVPTPADNTRTLYDYIEVYLHRIALQLT